MSGSMMVLAAAGAFVLSHFLLSHPLRRPLVNAMGEKGFLGLYSAVALITFGLTVWAFRQAPATPPLWQAGDGLWAFVTVAMLAASILLLGIASCAIPPCRAPPPAPRKAEARSMLLWRRTQPDDVGLRDLGRLRHSWCIRWRRTSSWPAPYIVLALVSRGGAAAQQEGGAGTAGLDRLGEPDQLLAGIRGHCPAGKAYYGGFGGHAIGGGIVVWLLATWAHIPLAGWAAGIWRWLT